MTGFLLPAQVTGGTSGWALADLKLVKLSAVADATGTATIDCGQIDPALRWLVDRVAVQCTPAGSPPPALRLYDSAVSARNFLDGTASGALNSNDYPQGLLVQGSGSLVAQWTGAPTGAACTLTAQVRVFAQGGS